MRQIQVSSAGKVVHCGTERSVGHRGDGFGEGGARGLMAVIAPNMLVGINDIRENTCNQKPCADLE